MIQRHNKHIYPTFPLWSIASFSRGLGASDAELEGVRVSNCKLEWQKKWREALGQPTDSMPDYREDYELQFDIWDVDEEKLAACFAIFPNGAKILQRVNNVRSHLAKKVEIDDKTLIRMLNQMNQDIESVLFQYGDEEAISLNAEKATIKKRSIYKADETLRREVFNQADTPLVHLDDVLVEIIEKHHGELGYEAFFFLSEPLYQLSGSNYEVSHWIIWAMVEDKFEIDPYYQAYEMYKIGAQAGWSDEELFVYIAK